MRSHLAQKGSSVWGAPNLDSNYEEYFYNNLVFRLSLSHKYLGPLKKNQQVQKQVTRRANHFADSVSTYKILRPYPVFLV